MYGLQGDKLDAARKITEVVAVNSDKVTQRLTFYQTTSNYALRFKSDFKESGKYTISVKYNNKDYLKCEGKDILVVIDNIYKLDHSKLKMITNNIVELSKTSRTTIDNIIYQPSFKLEFYTKDDVKTDYDKNIPFELILNANSMSEPIIFQANKNNNEFVQFPFPENNENDFTALKRGEYNLTLKDDKDTVIYPITLTGDNYTDSSNERNYDISKTEVKPTTIDVIAGKVYTITVEFRAVDNLRWNYVVNTSLFKVTHSQKDLKNNEITKKIENGPKKGQVIILVNQTKVTGNNILTFTYNNKNIPKKVTLKLKCAELYQLKLYQGPTNGNVINPPEIKFEPLDKYNNLFTNLFTSYTQAQINALTVGKSLDYASLTSNNYLSEKKYLVVQYNSTKSTDVVVTSDYFKDSYEYRIYSGPIDKDISYGEIKSSTNQVGGEYILLIYPKDLYNNDIDGLNETHLNNFHVDYKVVGENDIIGNAICKLVEESPFEIPRALKEEKIEEAKSEYNSIECRANITKAGDLQFVIKYNEDDIYCKDQCRFTVIPSTLFFSNTKTNYINKNIYLSESKSNEVDIGTTPIFKVEFYDPYNNQLEASTVNNIQIKSSLGGTEVKLCVSNEGKTKLIKVCPTYSDDNENKWKYLTNGDKYKLIIYDTKNSNNKITYPIKLIGGAADGSSDEPDWSKTYISNDTLTIVAGEEGKIDIQINTKNNERKNYWYPEINEKIKIKFNSDEDTCTSNIAKGEKPGQYMIKINCTKTTDSNGFSIIIEGNTLNKNVNLIITHGLAYYLEVANTTQFTVSSDKYTWKTNPTNDDTISFSYKFKDKYQNYITSNLIGTNQYTVTSSKFGTDNSYYSLDFNNDNYKYLFTDKINQVITKHTWNIEIRNSNRKYSFIYTKNPGAPNLSKSYWSIDKNSYIFKETSTVKVYLLDQLGVNLGTLDGKLKTESSKVKVITNKGSNKYYTLKSYTSSYISYTYTYKETGDYKVSVTYNGNLIGKKIDINIAYPKADLKTSKLYYNIDNQNDILMSTSTQINIDNKNKYPFYNFYLYTADNEKITLYNPNLKATCLMTYETYEWEMDATQLEDHIKITYKSGFEETFSKLPFGLYYIQITYNEEVSKYPVFLLGEKDVSPSSDYDLGKIYIKPTEIEAIAGEEKEVEIEFRATDGLRWNRQINLVSFGVSNSYQLNEEQLKIEKIKGEKNGQMKLKIIQTNATTTSVDKTNNILTLTYESKTISQKIYLTIKPSSLKTLSYREGLEDGTVINPPMLKFLPFDEYGNTCTRVFDSTEYSNEKLQNLAKGISKDGYNTISNIKAEDGHVLISYGCYNVTTIEVTSEYFSDTYSYKLNSGPIDSTKSYAQVTKTENIIAGEINTINIYPKDKYGNDITSLISDDVDKFDVQYSIGGDSSIAISKGCQKKEGTINYITCETNITKSGDIIFSVDYSDKIINCNNCEFKINPNVLDFSKTIVINQNTNKEMSRTDSNTLTVTTNPIFILNFFDRFMNSIINQNEINNLEVKTNIEITDVELCVENGNLNKKSSLCKSSSSNENEEKWKYITDSNSYKLLVYNSDIVLTYPLKITGGYTEGNSGPIDITKAYINPTTITLTAGEESSVNLELRTNDNVRKNYWFKDINNHLNVKFPENINDCSKTITEGTKPGQYIFKFICIGKKDTFQSTISIDNTDVPQKVSMKVVPNQPNKTELYHLDGIKITDKYLPSVSVEDKFQIKSKIYDKYDNLITNIDFDLSILKLRIAPSTSVKNYEYSIVAASQSNGEIIITARSTYAGAHTIMGALLPLDEYSITFTPGNPSADNSLLEVSTKETWVGEIIQIYITPYDQYFNLIDANKYKDESPYQVKYANAGSSTINVIKEKPSIKTVNNVNVISYPGAFYVRGYTTFTGYLDINPIKCVSCRVDIKSKDIDFKSSLAMRYESTKNDYENLKDGTIEKNTKEEPIYRLYPRDKYLNTIDYIPEEKLKTYKAYLKSQEENVTYNFALNNKEFTNQPYAEFIISDDDTSGVTYATLVKGYYSLIFTDGIDSIIYNISLEGDETGGSNEEVDYQKAYINEQNLKFIAGESGYIVLEIRTINNKRKNFWNYDIKVTSCNKDDKTFKAEVSKAGLKGVFQVTITTNLANTYPSITACPLSISIDGVLVNNLKPEMEVSPNVIVKTEIIDKYYKDKTNNELLDGNADKNYIFEVASFDEYNNLAETKQDTIGLKINLKGGKEINETTSDNIIETGYRNYSVPATKAGIYVVSTSKLGPKGIYLENEAKFTINHGAIDLSKTVVKEKVTPIQAGNKPAITIVAYDKYGNQLDYNKYIDKFKATFIDPDNKEFTTSSKYDSGAKKVIYTSKKEVTLIGETKVEVIYDNKEKIITSGIIITIIPGDPYPPNSILSRETSSGVFTEYKNGDSFILSPSETPKLNMTLYDKYNNYISQLPSDADVTNPIMSGNKMKEITFSVTKNKDNFDLDFNGNSEYVHIYHHLVKGKYDLNLKVSSSLGNQNFHYNIIINTGDDLHGNGDYVISKCVLTPKEISFSAGNYEKFNLELRTEEGLLYNDDIDINNDISVYNNTADDSFKYTIAKAGTGYGLYTITIYSEMKGKYKLDVLLKDLTDEKLKNLGSVIYSVTPDPLPDKRYTKIIKQPDSTISTDTIISITFYLFDKYENQIEDKDNIIKASYFTVFNNNIPYSYKSLSFDTKVDVSLMPKYPPNTMSINIVYNNGESTIELFENNIDLTILSSIDYTKTLIVSSNKEKIYAGQKLDMWLYTYDKSFICFDNNDVSAQFKIEVIGPLDTSKQRTNTSYVYKTNRDDGNNCKNEYQINATDIYTYAGNYLIRVLYGENHLIAQYDQVCYPLGYSLDGFYLQYSFNPDSISILDSPSFTITGSDQYGNTVTEPLFDKISINFTLNNEWSKFETNNKLETTQGTLNYQVSINKVGSHQLHMYYEGKEILTINKGKALPKFTILTGPCYANNNDHIDLTPLENAEVSLKTHFTLYCFDKFGNEIKKGGEKFTVKAEYFSSTSIGDSFPLDNAKVIDNDNGSYNVEFTPAMKGKYTFNIYVGKEKYGEEITWELTAFTCRGEKSVACPNKRQCVSNIIECIEPDKRCNDTAISKTKPFYCKVNDEYKCTESQTDCDCPDGYKKCSIMNYCVPDDREDMCPVFNQLLFYCMSKKMTFNYDGICRKVNRGPNQRVCPIGKVLCADLSCRDNYDQCVITEEKAGTSMRCIGQQIVSSATACPSSITCSSNKEYVCPTGECVSNEVYCPGLNKCNENYPYLCQNNVCAKDFQSCAPSISCGENKLLCSDNICRENC